MDEQRIGPYKFWYHYHQVDEEDGRVKLTDRIFYEVPYGLFGKILHKFIIRKTLKKIFDFRSDKLAELLNTSSPD